ncbi:MAG: cytidylyltransferase domain-containing protein [Eubacterium sp.]
MNVAFIPVRGGSKSIPLKNIKPICGRSLVYWTVRAASLCKHIDAVYVATDNDLIKETVEAFKLDRVQVIGRSAESASDTASTESAMLEFAENYDFDNIVLIQATSPLLTAEDLNRGFEAFAGDDTDSVLSVVKQLRFNWAADEKGYVAPTNYDVFNRPRRQDFDGYLVENGAFYITGREALLKSQNRVSGKIRPCIMSEDTFFEIDEPSDWIIIEALMKKRGLNQPKSPKNIKMVVTDCDGCLTDAGMYYSENGDELKKFNTKDGLGFGLLRKNGILTGIITGEDVQLNRRRAEKLGLDFIENGVRDKAAVLTEVCNRYNISPENVAYIGDDINDLPAMKTVGFSACPSDAVDAVLFSADYVCRRSGGNGAVREVIDLILNN